jgi:hypothetical protein
VLTWCAVARVSVALLLVVAGPRPSRRDPEPWTLIKRDQCRHLAAYARSDKRSPSRDQVVAVHVLTHEAMRLSDLLGEAAVQRGRPARRPHRPAGRRRRRRGRAGRPPTGATSTR